MSIRAAWEKGRSSSGQTLEARIGLAGDEGMKKNDISRLAREASSG